MAGQVAVDVRIAARIPAELGEALRNIAADRNTTLSEVVRAALEAVVAAERASAEGIRRTVGTWQIAGCGVRFFRSPTTGDASLPWLDLTVLLEAAGASPEDCQASLALALERQPDKVRLINTASGPAVVASPFYGMAVLDTLVSQGFAPERASDDCAAAILAATGVLTDGMGPDQLEAFMIPAVARASAEAGR